MLDYTPQTVAGAWKEYDIGLGVFAPNPDWDPNSYWSWAPQKITVSEDKRPYNFECGRTQSWTFNPGGLVGSIASSTTRAYSGRSSLAVNLSAGAAGTWGVWSNTNPKPGAGQTVQFRVYIPTGSSISAVQAFVKEGASGSWRWTGNSKSISQLTVGAWNSIPVTVPADAQPLDSLGVEFTTNAAWTGTAYIDAVEWPSTLPSAGPTYPTNPIAFTKGTVFTTNSGTTNWVYVPNSYDSTHATPTKLLVWLHGCDGRSQNDVSMVSPGGTQSWISLAVGGAEGACWNVNVDSAKVLAALADIKTHFNIDPKRVILGGYSSGGDLTYRTAFYNAGLFAGVIVENSSPFRDTGSTQSASIAAASWKFNVAHLLHTGDLTYPAADVRTELAALSAAGFPVTKIEKPGNHWDNDVGTTGTSHDLRTFLLPFIDAGWVANAP
jgi:pimeloyl-ACP methyl ester carboxylesterase